MNQERSQAIENNGHIYLNYCIRVKLKALRYESPLCKCFSLILLVMETTCVAFAFFVTEA